MKDDYEINEIVEIDDDIDPSILKKPHMIDEDGTIIPLSKENM